MEGTKIMIVEDELIVAKSLSGQLKKLGYEIAAVVASGEEAIDAATSANPELILMDIMLQGEIDGIEAAAKIWNDCEIPVIYLTANADRSTLERAKSSGSFGYIIKPFKKKELQAAIEIALGKHEEQKKERQELVLSENMRKKAEELSELKNRYMSITSHEFRNPLASILGSSELLEHYSEKWPEEKKRKHLHRIQDAVKRMNGLLEDILTLGRTESARISFEPAPLDLLQFCRSLINELPSSDRPNERIFFVASCDFTEACMDEKLLRHILTNLLSNALKYSPDGGSVDFTLTCQDGSAKFEVRDSGIGIPQKDLEKLFQTFHRASNVGQIPGTGLGLAIVKSFVELHGGNITVDSQVGTGTKFTVILPLQPPYWEKLVDNCTDSESISLV